jgi:hypothetical protein
MSFEDRPQEIAIVAIAFVEIGLLSGNLFHSPEQRPVATGKVIDNYGFMARLNNFKCRVSADISGSTCNEYFFLGHLFIAGL